MEERHKAEVNATLSLTGLAVLIGIVISLVYIITIHGPDNTSYKIALLFLLWVLLSNLLAKSTLIYLKTFSISPFDHAQD